MAFSKIKFLQFLALIIATTISAMGTVPYAYRFGEALWRGSQLIVVLGIVLAVTAVLANAALGTYSLLSMRTKQTMIKPAKLIVFSFLSAIPVGFMCYSAYQSIFSVPLNILISCIVTMVNTAIGYTAVLSLYAAFKEVKTSLSGSNSNAPRLTIGELVFKLIGLLVGIIVSLTAYLAAIHGILQILHVDFLSEAASYRFAIVIGFLNWVPYAALFSNATQAVFGKLYQFLRHFSEHVKKVSLSNLLIFIIAWFSAASFAQIVSDYFSPDMALSEFFKLPQMQAFVLYALVPAAYLTSFAVNYLALQNLLSQYVKASSNA